MGKVVCHGFSNIIKIKNATTKRPCKFLPSCVRAHILFRSLIRVRAFKTGAFEFKAPRVLENGC